MKKNLMKRAVSLLLMVVLIGSCAIISVNAESVGYLQASETEEKISDCLWEKIKEANDNDKFSVWIWFSDIDQEKVDQQVKKDTGLTADDIAVNYQPASDDLIRALENASEDAENAGKVKSAENKLKAYIDSTSAKRAQEQNRVTHFVKARRQASRDLYVEKNMKLVKELNLPQKEIAFQSQLTPSVIIKLSKTQILETAKSVDVVSIDYYDDSVRTEPLCENQRKTMRVDQAREQFGLTGEGVNVLMNDHGCVRSDAYNYPLVSNPDAIKAVVNKTIYPVTNTSVMPGTSGDTHPTLIAAEMQAFAPDVHIYSVGYGDTMQMLNGRF